MATYASNIASKTSSSSTASFATDFSFFWFFLFFLFFFFCCFFDGSDFWTILGEGSAESSLSCSSWSSSSLPLSYDDMRQLK